MSAYTWFSSLASSLHELYSLAISTCSSPDTQSYLFAFICCTLILGWHPACSSSSPLYCSGSFQASIWVMNPCLQGVPETFWCYFSVMGKILALASSVLVFIVCFVTYFVVLNNKFDFWVCFMIYKMVRWWKVRKCL